MTGRGVDAGDYAERVYAGVLGKFIGVYLGRPVEGWPYADIQSRFGLVDHYVADELGIPLIVADDDISGTFVFARAVEDSGGRPTTAADVGSTWLDYIIEDRTILWWGGFGRSTEHTAYLNLKRGIPAPRSGSIEENGQTLAEQIGAQIFSDAFALLHPGDPEGAVRLTREAASVSHDGVALDTSAFLAAMRAAAFDERDLDMLTEVGRSYVSDPRLLGIIDDVSARFSPIDDWREARDYVDHVYGYSRYPGPCHSLANTAMTLTALRLGGDDFGRAVAIAASVGFDTDSNAGTVGCLNGVRLGIAGLDAVPALREPIADRAIVVSADGGEAVTDASRETTRLVASARALAGRPPAPRAPRLDFSLPGAVHGFTVCPHRTSTTRAAVANENRFTGVDALTVRIPEGEEVFVSTPTFLDPRERMTNFSTVASPTLYPSDTVTALVSAIRGEAVAIRLYALYAEGGRIVVEESQRTPVGTSTGSVTWTVPARGNLVPFRLGIRIDAAHSDAVLRLHSVDWTGAPASFQQRGILLESIWDTAPRALEPWVSSARNWEADFGSTYCVSHPDAGGVVTIGTREWVDYGVASVLTLSRHDAAGLVVRARGHRSFSAAIFTASSTMLVDEVSGHRQVLASVPFAAPLDVRLAVELRCRGDELTLLVEGDEVLRARTSRLAGGGAGFLVDRGTFTADGFAVTSIPHTMSDEGSTSDVNTISDTHRRKATA